MSHSKSYDNEMKMVRIDVDGKYMKIIPLEGLDIMHVAYHFIKQHDLDEEGKERIKTISDIHF